jgi:hypothetical protein
MDPAAAALNASVGFDRRLLRDDVRGSQAHARMLAAVGLISNEDTEAIVAGLDRARVVLCRRAREYAATLLPSQSPLGAGRVSVVDLGEVGRARKLGLRQRRSRVGGRRRGSGLRSGFRGGRRNQLPTKRSIRCSLGPGVSARRSRLAKLATNGSALVRCERCNLGDKILVRHRSV